MNKSNILKISFIIILIISLNIFSGCTTTTNNAKDDENGENFSFSLLDGTTKQLQDYRGKVVIIDLWATWCQPCVYQMLELRKVYDNYTRDQLEILSINTDSSESVNQIQDFLDELASYGFNLEWIIGREQEDLSNYNPKETIPRLIVFDQQGTIHWEHNGLTFFSEFPEGWTGGKTLLKEKIDELIR